MLSKPGHFLGFQSGLTRLWLLEQQLYSGSLRPQGPLNNKTGSFWKYLSLIEAQPKAVGTTVAEGNLGMGDGQGPWAGSTFLLLLAQHHSGHSKAF